MAMSSMDGSLGDNAAAPQLEVTERLYDTWAATYDKTYLDWGYAAPKRIAELCDQYGLAKNGRIFDVGCGTGMSGESLKAVGFTDLTGADLSSESLALLRDQKPDVYGATLVLNMDETPYPFDACCFDAVTCVGVLAYFKGRDSFDTIFGEFVRILKPGGLVFLTQREDLLLDAEHGTRDAIDALHESGAWQCIYESKPESYVPTCPKKACDLLIRSFVLRTSEEQSPNRAKLG